MQYTRFRNHRSDDDMALFAFQDLPKTVLNFENHAATDKI